MKKGTLLKDGRRHGDPVARKGKMRLPVRLREAAQECHERLQCGVTEARIVLLLKEGEYIVAETFFTVRQRLDEIIAQLAEFWADTRRRLRGYMLHEVRVTTT